MGKTLDALLGRGFKPSKFKALLNLALSRLAVFKNQRHTRCSNSRSDIVQLLNLGEHERALIRVEQVIKECNMLDVFAMIEGYCVLLSERVKVIEHDKVCPDELKEAVSTLIFTASRCGEFPEMQEIRRVLTSRYGKEFSRCATELRNNCGVNPKMIQKLSTRTPSLERRLSVLKEIAKENGIKLQVPSEAEDKQNTGSENRPEGEQKLSPGWHGPNLGEGLKSFPEEIDKMEGFADLVNRRKQYKHVADAAEEAYLSAAYAAAAARAAVELSRSNPRQPDEPTDPESQRKQIFGSKSVTRVRGDTSEGESAVENENHEIEFDKDHPANKYSPGPENDGEAKKNEGPETILVKQLPRGVKYKEDEFDKKAEKHNTVDVGDRRGEKRVELPCHPRKQTPSSFHTVSRTDDKVHSPSASEIRSPPRLNIERKLISLRTRR